MNKIEQQREHFENISEKYFTARKTPNHLLIKKLIWEYFFSRTNLKNKSYEVLEPMCGYAEGKLILELYGNINIQYIGFDYSQTLIDLVKKEKPELNIYWQDITTISENEYWEIFDLIIIIGGLHHVYEKTGLVLNKLSSMLKKDGHFINFEPTQNFILFKKVREIIYNKNELFDEDTEQAYDLNELNDLYTNNGFQIVEQIYPGLLSYILYYNPDAFPLLNHGGAAVVKASFVIDRLFMKNFIGRKFSFATMTLLRKTG